MLDHITPTVEMHPIPSGVELHVLRWEPPSDVDASRRTWVLTHGLASNARLWDGVARRLAASGHRVVTIDQRGHGQSSKPDDGYDVWTCADDLALLIDTLELDRPAVAGQSWGGNVVLELGHRHPEMVDQVACVDGGFIDLRSKFPAWEDCADGTRASRGSPAPRSTRCVAGSRRRLPIGPKRAAPGRWPTSRSATTTPSRRGSRSTVI